MSIFGISLNIYFNAFYILILPLLFAQFAKHMKIEEQVTLLKNKKIGVGVGTPARLMELIDNGEFSTRLPVAYATPVTITLTCSTQYADINGLGRFIIAG